jgi:hypothetical protein
MTPRSDADATPPTVGVVYPDADHFKLTAPDEAEVKDISDAITSAITPPGGLTPTQRLLLEAIVPALTGHPVHLDACAPVDARRFAEIMANRGPAFRSRIVQLMVLCALVLRPLPEEVAARIAEFAREVGVDDDMVTVAKRFASGSLGLAALDFERNGYTSTWDHDRAHALHTSAELEAAWDVCVNDPGLAARWQALEHLPEASIGRRVWEMYQARGFQFPGTPGSAPPLLAQHDWVHVLADYGTTVESEIEVFAFIARANDDMHAFSLLAMVVSLFETGYLRAGAGLFESSPNHLSDTPGVAVRLADAMRRGALCHDHETGSDSIDYLEFDWFSVSHLPSEEVRKRFNVVDKSEGALAAGSLGPWCVGGISPFQLNAGKELAEQQARPYEAYGAAV